VSRLDEAFTFSKLHILVRRSPWICTPLVLLSLLAACSTDGPARLHAPPTCRSTEGTCSFLIGNRFTVSIDRQVLALAHAQGADLAAQLSLWLHHVASLLPGPPTSISIVTGVEGIDPNIGVGASTSAVSGSISISVRPVSRILVRDVMGRWLRQALSHEVDHSVRALDGPGLGTTLLDYFVNEGLADAFDRQAWPGMRLPWDHALTTTAERELWARARPQLSISDPAAYQPWFFGGPGIPRWAGFTIGHDMVDGYLARHPKLSAASLVRTPATSILAGSGFAP